jgi:hypothetical protein
MTSQDDTESANGTHGTKRSFLLILIIVAGIYFLALMLMSTHYGYFRDALYYLACSEHLAWGHVGQPPLIVLIAWTGRHTLGTSLPALMFWPALFCPCANLLTSAFRRKPAPSIRWQEAPTRFADDPTDPLGRETGHTAK